MVRYVVRRGVFIVVALLVILFITFMLMHLAPGSFLDINMLQSQLGSTADQQQVASQINEWKSKYRLDRPLWRQYVTYVWDLVRWDVGPSFRYPNVRVEDMVAAAFPVSATLAVLGVVLAALVGIPLGIAAALNYNHWLDYVSTVLSLIGMMIPPYVAAVFLMLLFSLQLGWLPTGGWGRPVYYVLPVMALSLGPIATIARYLRASLVEILNVEYIRTAWAKGGTDRAVVFGHALRNALIPLVTVLGPTLSYLIIGTLFVENMFRIPGLGRLFAAAAQTRDYPLLMTCTAVFAAVVMVMNLCVDLTYGLLDPRIKHE